MREVVRGMRSSDDMAGFRLMKAGLVSEGDGMYACPVASYINDTLLTNCDNE